MHKAAFLVSLALAISAGPAVSQEVASGHAANLDFLERMLLSQERTLRESVIDALGDENDGRRLAKFDGLVDEIEQPSQLHAFVAVQGASTLAMMGRGEEAKARFEELLRMYPTVAGVRFEAISSLAYTRQAPEAARLWIELAAIQPDIAKMIDGYTLGALLSNAQAQGRRDSRDALLLALDRIGYESGSAALRSEMLEAVFRNSATDPDRHAEAIGALKRMEDPELLRSILANRSYERFWPEIPSDRVSWISRVESHLANLASDSAESDFGQVEGAFITRVQGFTGPETVLAAYLPRLREVLAEGDPTGANHEYVFWVAPLAKALVLAGDPAQAKQVLLEAARVYGAIGSVNRLNVAANYALFLVAQGRADKALEVIEPAIAELDSKNTSSFALAQMQAVRVRALHRLDRMDEAKDALAVLKSNQANMLQTYADTMLQIGRPDAARDAVVASLRSPFYASGIEYLQPPMNSHLTKADREIVELRALLRQEAAVQEALNEVGRIVEIEPIAVEDFSYPVIAS